MGVQAKLLLGAPTALTVKPAWHTVLQNANATSTTAPARAISAEAHASTHTSTNANTRHVHERTHTQHAGYACAHTHSDGVMIVAELARPCSGRIVRIIAGHAAAVRSFLAAFCSEPSHAGIPCSEKTRGRPPIIRGSQQVGTELGMWTGKTCAPDLQFFRSLHDALCSRLHYLTAAGLYDKNIRLRNHEPRTLLLSANSLRRRSGQTESCFHGRKDEIETKQH